MKRRATLELLLLVAASCGCAPAGEVAAARIVVPEAGHETVASAPVAEFFVYINGDNDLVRADGRGGLVSQGALALRTWERIATNSGRGFSFHLYFDPNGAISGEQTRTLLRRYRDGVQVQEESWEETNSAESVWVERLLSGADEGSTRRVTVFFGHGRGWRDVESYDYSHPEARFNYLELAPLLRQHRVDLLVFDACAMAWLETLAAFSDSVKFLVGSQYDLPIDGIDFSGLPLFLQGITSDVEDGEFFAELFRTIARDTQRVQRQAGLIAPLLYFDLQQFDGFIQVFQKMLLDFGARLPQATVEANNLLSELARRARPRLRGAVLSEPGAVDLRGFLWELQQRPDFKTFDGSTVLKRYEALALDGMGSLQFFLDRWSPGESRDQDRAAALGLENWALMMDRGISK